MLKERVFELESRNKELETRLNLNSTNSSIPSSKNPLNHKKIPNSRVPSGKKPGGQTGHKGTTLKSIETIDIKINHAPKVCSGCGATVQTEIFQLLKLLGPECEKFYT